MPEAQQHPDPAIINGKPYRIVLWGSYCRPCNATTLRTRRCADCDDDTTTTPLWRLVSMNRRTEA
jgi:hypothetical protein